MVGSPVKIFRRAVLPAIGESRSIYFIQAEYDGNPIAELYLCDAAGVMRPVSTTQLITDIATALFDDMIGAINTMYKVLDIDARDALAATLTMNSMILVVDATGDPTVSSGSALYFYDATAEEFTKVAEYESMDVVVQWEDITGKPTSTPLEIDEAVALRHDHANKTVLDKFGEAGGDPTYDGEPLAYASATQTRGGVSRDGAGYIVHGGLISKDTGGGKQLSIGETTASSDYVNLHYLPKVSINDAEAEVDRKPFYLIDTYGTSPYPTHAIFARPRKGIGFSEGVAISGLTPEGDSILNMQDYSDSDYALTCKDAHGTFQWTDRSEILTWASDEF